MKQVKQMGNSVFVATIHRLQHDKSTIRENIRKTGKTGIFAKRPTVANVDVVRNIRNMIKIVNPPT